MMMPRKLRIEVEGGLYHVYTRGNNRRLIFDDDYDYRKMIKLISETKRKLPFYLYAHCLMPNHFHLLMEQQKEPISRIMHSLVTRYSRYYNRRNRRVGHLFQSRYKSILCQSDQYLAELVRYIHLNPVRAKIVSDPAAFRYSGHRAYLGIDDSKLLDVGPVLRLFGATKKIARERYIAFVKAGMKLGGQEELYRGADGPVLGDEEFVESMQNRVGKVVQNTVKKIEPLDLELLLEAAANATLLTHKELRSSRKNREIVIARDALIIVGQEMGASNADLAQLIGVDSSTVSKRFATGIARMKDFPRIQNLIEEMKTQFYKSKPRRS